MKPTRDFTTAIPRLTRGRVVLIEPGSPVAFHKSVCVHQEGNAAGVHVSHIPQEFDTSFIHQESGLPGA